MSVPAGWAELVIALSVLIPAATASYLSLRRKVDAVHQVVNSRYDELQSKLDRAIQQRDEARSERNNVAGQSEEQDP
jgi:hypothetical protein